MLLGFFDERRAVRQILNQVCVCRDTRPEILKMMWRDARRQRGGTVAKAGAPAMTLTPATMDQHIKDVKALDRLQKGVDGLAFEVQMVEAGKLLALQAGVREDRVAIMQGILGAAPTDQQLVELFLPLKAGLDLGEVQVDEGPPIRWITRNPNAVVHGAAAAYDQAARQFQMVFFIGEREPCVTVAEYKGKYFLKNGYHRVLAAVRCGLDNIPALVVHAPGWDKVNPLLGKDWFFDPGTLTQEQPTISHFDNACRVEIRLFEQNLVFSQATSARPI
jgi:hypothetical protein